MVTWELRFAVSECRDKRLVDVGNAVLVNGHLTLAHVLVAKYADHLLLYQQEQIFVRAGLPIARSTLADWVDRCGFALQPLADALRQTILSYPVVHADEIPVSISVSFVRTLFLRIFITDVDSEAARKNKGMQFMELLHHVTPQLLAQSFYALRHDAPVGVDGMLWQEC